MKNVFLLARKDFASCFHSWTGVLILVFFYFIAGLFFVMLVFNYSKLSMDAARNAYAHVQGLGLTRFVFSSLFLNLSVVLIFLVPVLAMRSFAEERKLQTLELLFTDPFSDFEIVFGKFLGLVWFFEALFLPAAGYVGIVYWLGGNLDWGPILLGFLGFWLLGTAYLSLGLFISTLTENQIVSAIVTFGFLVIFWILEWVGGMVSGPWAFFFALLSPLSHYQDFTLGIFDLSHLAYFCFFQFYFLFLTLRSIETRNWKG